MRVGYSDRNCWKILKIKPAMISFLNEFPFNCGIRLFLLTLGLKANRTPWNLRTDWFQTAVLARLICRFPKLLRLLAALNSQSVLSFVKGLSLKGSDWYAVFQNRHYFYHCFRHCHLCRN